MRENFYKSPSTVQDFRLISFGDGEGEGGGGVVLFFLSHIQMIFFFCRRGRGLRGIISVDAQLYFMNFLQSSILNFCKNSCNAIKDLVVLFLLLSLYWFFIFSVFGYF